MPGTKLHAEQTNRHKEGKPGVCVTCSLTGIGDRGEEATVPSFPDKSAQQLGGDQRENVQQPDSDADI